jgi:hypothetical protein
LRLFNCLLGAKPSLKCKVHWYETKMKFHLAKFIDLLRKLLNRIRQILSYPFLLRITCIASFVGRCPLTLNVVVNKFQLILNLSLCKINTFKLFYKMIFKHICIKCKIKLEIYIILKI